jgi:hypothetical protein
MKRTQPPNPLKVEKLHDGRIALSRADGTGEVVVLTRDEYSCFITRARSGVYALRQLDRQETMKA